MSTSRSTQSILSTLGSCVTSCTETVKNYLPAMPSVRSPYNFSTLFSLLALPTAVLSSLPPTQYHLPPKSAFFSADGTFYNMLVSEIFKQGDKLLDLFKDGLCNLTAIDPVTNEFTLIENWQSKNDKFLMSLSRGSQQAIQEAVENCTRALIAESVHEYNESGMGAWESLGIAAAMAFTTLILIGGTIKLYKCVNSHPTHQPLPTDDLATESTPRPATP